MVPRLGLAASAGIRVPPHVRCGLPEPPSQLLALESALRETPWISHAVVVGDRRSFVVALLTLDLDEAPRLAEELGIAADLASMAADEGVRAALQRDVDGVRQPAPGRADPA